MPVDPITAGIIIAGAAGSAYQGYQNRKAQKEANIRNAQLQYEMNRRNRQYALEDYQKEVEYANPANQMRRLKQAGLNPNLIYGKINPAIPTVKATTDKAAVIAPEKFNTNAFQSLMGNANVFNQAEVLKSQAGLAKSSEIKNYSEAAKTDRQNKLFDDLYQNTVKQAEEELINKKLKNQAQQIANQFEKESYTDRIAITKNNALAKYEDYLQKQWENSTNKFKKQYLQQQLKMIKNKNIILKWEADLTKQNVRPGDNFLYRWTADWWNNMGAMQGNDDITLYPKTQAYKRKFSPEQIKKRVH